MLERCYNTKYQTKQPTYKGCTVSKEWLVFSNFKNWMVAQDWKYKELDKDLLVIGNKVYSEQTCLFITKELNNLLTTNNATRGIYKQGVCLDKRSLKFVAHCSVDNKKKFLGSFYTEEEASQAYRLFKYNHLKAIALEQIDYRVKTALNNYASIYL